jgi:DeoR family fructose operon transcriptional repressor
LTGSRRNQKLFEDDSSEFWRFLMLAETRRRQLLELVNRQGFATLDELVRALGVSESTVRRDLEALDQAGAVKRTHGGAVCSAEVRAMPAFDERQTAQEAEKRAIGALAAALVGDGETVLLDGGTTTLEVARALVGRPVQVVTNSLPIAHLIAARKETDLILIGGYVSPRTGVAMGPLAVATMQGIRVAKVMMGAGGIVPDGVYNSNSLLVETERQMMQCGQEVIVVADHTKFGRLSLTRLCGLDEIHAIVVDDGLSPRERAWLDPAGLTIHVAPTATPAESNGAARGDSPARTGP